jgi:spore germination protein GerM
VRRRAAAIFLAVVAVLALLGLWMLRRGRRSVETPPAPNQAAAAPAAAPLALTLYFPGEDGRLYPERRELEVEPGATARARAVLAALLGGPRLEGLRAPLPAGVELGSVAILGDGIVIVDLRSPGHELPPAAGSLGERATVYSLVNTVLLNVEGTKRVALLWNGVQRESFSGHLDTTRPLAADLTLLEAR